MNYRARVHAALDRALSDDSLHSSVAEALRAVKANVKVEMSNRMTRAAGKASVEMMFGKIIPSTLTLKLSVPLMGRATEEEREETITHEIAHLVDYVLRGKSDHGPIWKRIHRALGGTGARCHNIDRTGLKRAVTRHEYKDHRTGRVVLFTNGNHQKVMRYGLTHRYEYLATVKMRGKEVVSRVEAQRAMVA